MLESSARLSLDPTLPPSLLLPTSFPATFYGMVIPIMQIF